jgi:hypothetical protein
VTALVVGWEGGDPELSGERRDPLLGRPDPLAADLDHLAVADLLVEQAAADAVARLEHDRPLAGGGNPAGGDKPGEARSDDRDVSFNRIVGRSSIGLRHGHRD